jgi:hypothetical protein
MGEASHVFFQPRRGGASILCLLTGVSVSYPGRDQEAVRRAVRALWALQSLRGHQDVSQEQEHHARARDALPRMPGEMDD